MRTLHRALLVTAAASLGFGCSPHDPRMPHQLPEPVDPNVPPAVVIDLAAANQAAPSTPAEATSKPETTPTPTDPNTKPPEPTPVPTPTPEPEIDPATLEDGAVAAQRMLMTGQYGNAPIIDTWCKESIARAKGVRKRLQGAEPDDATTLADFNQMSLELDTVTGLTSLLFEVSPDETVRKTSQDCTQALSKFTTETSLDRRLYDALSRVDTSKLDETGKYFVEKKLRDFRRSGVDKDDKTRARITDINAELVKLDQDYSKGVNDDKRSITVPLADLKGLPEDWIKGHEVKDGAIQVSTEYPDFFPFETYSPNAELRAKLYRENLQRGFPGNADRLKRVLSLRKELANLLGYGNWAEYATEDKMTGSAAAAEKFIEDINAIIRPLSDKETARLIERKKKDVPDATTFEVYDRFYYANVLRSEEYDFDAQSVRPYFSYDKVKDGIFALYSKLFGIQMTRVDGAAGWAPDVEVWEVQRNGVVIARFFLDMHPRENKYGHAAMFPIQIGLESQGDKPGRLAWASLVCNFPAPSEGSEALMEHSDVVTFFHEFGHLIHHVLAQKGGFVDLAGINVEWDFVEAPSQLLEEWAWDPKVLATFAKDAKGKTIPKAMVDKMKRAKDFGKAFDLQRQVYLTAFSFFLHTADPATLDLDEFTAEMNKRYSPFPNFEGDKQYANFGHLMGYSALYYTYQWSLVIAKDLFERFRQASLLDPKVAAEYTAKVLEPGGTKKAEALIVDFLGREQNLDAYKKWIAE